MKTPSFWYRSKFMDRVCGWALSPLSLLYIAGRWVHCAVTSPKSVSGVKVICLGNFNAGGAGKTPAAMALMQLIKHHYLADYPVFVTRGYGRASNKTLKVDPHKHLVQDVGEEALLLSRSGDVIVAKNRLAGVRKVKALGADLVIMDDGLQNRQVKADLNIALVDSLMGLGNRLSLPAGPLREPLSWGMKRVQAICLVGQHVLDTRFLGDMPLLRADVMTLRDDMPDMNANYFAFAGIGYPEKFFNYIRNHLGLSVKATRSFGDHYAYTAQDIKSMRARAKALNAKLLTTEKDLIQLERLNMSISDIKFVPIEMRFQDENVVIALLKKALKL